VETTVATTVTTTVPVIPGEVGGMPTWVIGVVVIIIVVIVLLIWRFRLKRQKLNISKLKIGPSESKLEPVSDQPPY